MSNQNGNNGKPVVIRAFVGDSYEGFHALRPGFAKSQAQAGKPIGKASAVNRGTTQGQARATAPVGRASTRNTSPFKGRT